MNRAHQISADPEDEPTDFDESSGSEPEEDAADGFAGREHYEKVGKSKLRAADAALLGPQYAGSRVKREGFEQQNEARDPFAEFGSDEESDAVNGLEDDDNEEPEDSASRSSGIAVSGDNDVEDMRSSDEDEDEDEDEEDEELEDTRSPESNRRHQSDDTAALKNILASQSASITTSLAASQRADALKGTAVKQQRKTFDALLNSRIRLQQGMVAMNTLPTLENQDSNENIRVAAEAAEKAARSLWTTLDSLRCTLDSVKTGTKRKRPAATASTPELWTHMSTLEESAESSRRTTLAKWSEKTAPAAAKAARSSNKLEHTRTEIGLLDVLDEQLADTERLVKKTRVPRASAPVQAGSYAAKRRAARSGGEDVDFDGDIYDDADFYSALLKDLLAQRQSNATPAPPSTAARSTPGLDLENEYRNASQKSAATKKAVDTRASKGRKMRYTVHEKLVNFMVPDDRGSWSDRQRAELVKSLFGAIVINSGKSGEVNGDEEADKVEGALRLFRG